MKPLRRSQNNARVPIQAMHKESEQQHKHRTNYFNNNGKFGASCLTRLQRQIQLRNTAVQPAI